MCNSASNGRKPQKAHSKTESRPTSADQQHRTAAHEQGPKKPATARSTQRALERTGAAEMQQHTAPNSPERNRIKSMRLRPDTRERSRRAQRP